MKLYHYTTSSVLLSVLENRQIWFTDFRFLNDTQEGILARKIRENTLAEFASEFKRKIETYNQLGRVTDPRTLFPVPQRDPFEALIDSLKENLPLNRPPSGVPESTPYVFSLSKDPDSLSHTNGLTH